MPKKSIFQSNLEKIEHYRQIYLIQSSVDVKFYLRQFQIFGQIYPESVFPFQSRTNRQVISSIEFRIFELV